MRFRILIADEARDQLRELPKEIRQNIGTRLESLQEGFSGDVKKLSGQEGKYRLRVGQHRILFALVKDEIQIYAVKNRRDAYE